MIHLKSLRLKFFAFLIVSCSFAGAGEVFAAGSCGTTSIPHITSVPATTLTTTLQVDAPLNGSYNCVDSHGILISTNTRTTRFEFRYTRQMFCRSGRNPRPMNQISKFETMR